MKHVYVLCLNDFPEAVFEKEEDAYRFREMYSMPNEGRYWHVKCVPLEPAEDWMTNYVKQRGLLEKRR